MPGRLPRTYLTKWLEWFDEGPIPVSNQDLVEYRIRGKQVAGPSYNTENLPGWRHLAARQGRLDRNEITYYRLVEPPNTPYR